MSEVIIVGASYAGLSAAMELRSRLPGGHQVTVVSANETFIFYPSLIWVVQGEREIGEISFPIRPVLEKAGISFIPARLETIDPSERQIGLDDGQSLSFDRLLIATGGEWEWETVPGLRPRPEGQTISMLSPRAALETRAHWETLLADPGPVVIGLASNAGLYGAAYEFALNLDIALRKAGVRDRAPITFVTPEPYLGHFGHDGLGDSRRIIEQAFERRQIMSVTEAQLARIEPDAVILARASQRLNSRFTMLVPPYRGIAPVRRAAGLADERGHIPVEDTFQSEKYPSIYGAGVAIQIQPQVRTLLPCGVLVTGTVSAEMGRIAAANIAADLGHGERLRRPAGMLKSFYVLDSGSHGLFMSLGSQPWLNVQVNAPGPWSHWAKVIAEKYQIWQLQAGRY